MKKKSQISKIVLLVCVLSVSGLLNAANWFVKGDGNANTTGGTSWATAVTLSKALTSAAVGDVIYMAAGTYTQTAYVSINKAYTVVGGFTGTETESSISISMSNPTINVTKLTQAASSTFRIMTINSGTDTGTATLQGVDFDGLNNNQNGQAIECSSSSTLNLIIKNCTFKNFAATATNVAGAININNITANATIQDCWFENITSGNNGGAISTNTKTGNTISITGCTFKTTTAPSSVTNYNGGAIYANGSSTNAYTLNIDNCTFNGTKAGVGGAIYSAAYITLNITNSTFQNCQTANTVAGSGHGGAIIFSTPVVNITNCKFDGCTDNGRGLIYWNAASTKSVIKKSIFTNNTSGGTTQNSGAVFGVQNASSFVTIDSCYAYNNTSSAHASSGSASVLYSAAGKSNITIKNSAFVGNVGKSNVTRAVVYATGQTTADTISFTNTIVSNNSNVLSATTDTLRDISNFSTLYGKVSYNNIIANGEYRYSGNNLSSPIYFKNSKYIDLLTASDMSTLTTPTAIADIVAAAGALMVKYNPSAGINTVSLNQNVFYSGDYLRFGSSVENVNIYNLVGERVKSLNTALDISLSDIPKGIYIVNYHKGGQSLSYKFIR